MPKTIPETPAPKQAPVNLPNPPGGGRYVIDLETGQRRLVTPPTQPAKK